MKKYLFIVSFFAMQKEYAKEKEKKDIFIASNQPCGLKLRRIKVSKILTDEKFPWTKIITDENINRRKIFMDENNNRRKKFSPKKFITNYFFYQTGRRKCQGLLKFIT